MYFRNAAEKSANDKLMRFYERGGRCLNIARGLVFRHSPMQTYFSAVTQVNESLISSPVLIVGIPRILGAGGGTL